MIATETRKLGLAFGASKSLCSKNYRLFYDEGLDHNQIRLLVFRANINGLVSS